MWFSFFTFIWRSFYSFQSNTKVSTLLIETNELLSDKQRSFVTLIIMGRSHYSLHWHLGITTYPLFTLLIFWYHYLLYWHLGTHYLQHGHLDTTTYHLLTLLTFVYPILTALSLSIRVSWTVVDHFFITQSQYFIGMYGRASQLISLAPSIFDRSFRMEREKKRREYQMIKKTRFFPPF